MGWKQQLSLSVSVEVPEGKGHIQRSEIRSLQRRLTCVALFVVFFTFTVTYLFYTNSDVLWGNETFFEETQEPQAALLEKPLTEDFPRLTNSSGAPGRDSSPAGDDDKVNRSENEVQASFDESNINNPRSLNVFANSTSSDLVMGTESSSTNASISDSYFEGAPSPTVNNGTLLKESFENSSTVEAEASSSTHSQLPPEEITIAKNTSDSQISKGGCDLKQGQWIPDSRLPLYNSSTCRYVQEFQNCEQNGRPDAGYLFWKWKPDQCEVPRVDATAFLMAMRNRSLVFAGDSIARNQFQSLLCVLSQVEEPKDTYHSKDDRNHVYLFQSFNVTLKIHWAPYLVRVEEKATTWSDNTTDIVRHIYLDELDDVWVKAAVGADILQISTGQWWYQRAMYLQKGKPVGCHAWPACSKQTGFAEPYSIALANILKGSLSIPGFSGTTVYRSFAPDHFEGGDWDTGGACPRTTPGGVPISPSAEWMYGIQIQQFQNVTEELRGGVAKHRLKMLDITNMAQIRGDGHPNGYRTRDDQQADATPDGRIRKDCLHWCLPGPIDAWNDLLVESLRDVIFK